MKPNSPELSRSRTKPPDTPGSRRNRRAGFPGLALIAALAALSFGATASFGQSGAPHPLPQQLPNGAVVVGKAQWLVQRPLPSFTLYTAGDQSTPADTLAQSGYWLLIYRGRNCAQCDALMQILSKRSQDASRMVFVVADISGSDLLLLEQKYPDLAQARWLRDVRHNFSSNMNIAGSPHVLGMRNGSIRWQRAGVSAADTTFPAAIDSWLKYNLLPPNKFVRTPLKHPANRNAPAAAAAVPADTKGKK
jgi:hypothetical protein